MSHGQPVERQKSAIVYSVISKHEGQHGPNARQMSQPVSFLACLNEQKEKADHSYVGIPKLCCWRSDGGTVLVTQFQPRFETIAGRQCGEAPSGNFLSKS